MNIDDFKRGWFIGDFDPSILRSKDIEVGFQEYKKGYVADNHYQRIAVEINLIAYGSVVANGKTYVKGDFFTFEPYMVCEVEFLEDSGIVCVKAPSLPNDKVSIDIISS